MPRLFNACPTITFFDVVQLTSFATIVILCGIFRRRKVAVVQFAKSGPHESVREFEVTSYKFLLRYLFCALEIDFHLARHRVRRFLQKLVISS